jgi:hypothetical protein
MNQFNLIGKCRIRAGIQLSGTLETLAAGTTVVWETEATHYVDDIVVEPNRVDHVVTCSIELLNKRYVFSSSERATQILSKAVYRMQ